MQLIVHARGNFCVVHRHRLTEGFEPVGRVIALRVGPGHRVRHAAHKVCELRRLLVLTLGEGVDKAFKRQDSCLLTCTDVVGLIWRTRLSSWALNDVSSTVAAGFGETGDDSPYPGSDVELVAGGDCIRSTDFRSSETVWVSA